MSSARFGFTSGVWSAVLLLATSGAWAQPRPAAPPVPAKYKALLRYHIPAVRDQHVMQYDSLVEHLKAANFEFQPPLDQRPETDREDRSKNLMIGLVPSGKVLSLLGHSTVAGLVIMPTDFMLPEQPDQPIMVRLELAAGLQPSRQLELANQVRALLRELDFHEAAAYDHHGYHRRPFTRLVGTIPAGNLEFLLKDLRDFPFGWLAPRIPRQELPTPVHFVNPILFAEVLPDPEPPKDLPEPAKREKEFLNKISADLWTLVSAKDQDDKEARLEIFLGATPTEGDRSWRQQILPAAPGLVLEGIQGQLVTGLGRIGHAPALAALTVVSGVRLAPPCRLEVDPQVSSSTDNDKAVRESGLTVWHQKKYRGQGVRLAILDTDFRGYQELVRQRRLPAKTRLVDLTTLHSPAFVPLPYSGKIEEIGHGTHCALAAAVAAPEAEIILIRIAGPSLLQLEQVVRYIRGDLFTEELERRQGELQTNQAMLRSRRDELLRERRVIMEDFTDETATMQDFEFLGPVRGWIFSRRDWHRQRMAYQEKEEQIQRDRESRFRQFLADLGILEGVTLVACPFVWGDGYALGGASPISRWFDNQAKLGLVWFQAAGHFRGQNWAGMYRDPDGNGVMDFVGPGTPLPKGRWNGELNFLAWEPFGGKRDLDLPAQTKVRLSLQWREPHDPDYFFRSDEPDRYRQPLADLRLVLLKQRDPEGKAVAADAFESVARSTDWPQRLDNQPAGSTYEQSLEITLEKAGRYAVRVERALPGQWIFPSAKDQPRLVFQENPISSGIRPPGVATLPALEKTFELWPRLLVQAVDDAASRQGRVVLLDFTTDHGSIGVPADARRLISVGAADLQGKLLPYCSTGGPAFAELTQRPTLLTFAGVGLRGEEKGPAHGASLATSFAAGMAATLLSSGITPSQLQQMVQQPNSQLWRVGPPQK